MQTNTKTSNKKSYRDHIRRITMDAMMIALYFVLDGASLKLIGSYAREDLERLLGTKVYLNLWVKVKENWRESARTVENFGYRNED